MRCSTTAPTSRRPRAIEELAVVGDRFAGTGPTLFTDFDEYSLYELRDLDVGGPDFVYSPPALAGAAGATAIRSKLDRLPPAALLSYPLIVTRRDPSAPRPPSAYTPALAGHLLRGVGPPPRRARGDRRHRARRARPASSARASGASPASRRAHARELVAASSPALVHVSLAGASHPHALGPPARGARDEHARAPLRRNSPCLGPASGSVWLQGQFMPTVDVDVDGRPLASIGGQLDGNSLVPNTITPLRASIPAGRHRLLDRPPRRLQPRSRRWRLGGHRRDLPHPRQRPRTGAAAHGRATRLALAVRWLLRVDRGRSRPAPINESRPPARAP